MDEPTNHLDIDSKEILEDALLDFNGTLFIISHDRYFLNKVANKILRLTPSGTEEFLGNYDYFLEKTTVVEYDDDEDQMTRTQLKELKKKEKEEAKKLSEQKKLLSKIEVEISELEDEISKIDEKLSQNEIASDYEAALELSEERQKLSDELDIVYEKWIELQ